MKARDSSLRADPINNMKRRLCKLPTAMTVNGRSSSITNAFINAIIPSIEPTESEALDALQILEIDPSDIRCAYCGDKSTEWDHLRPIITNQEPTGYITEIANLVPSCGKCNQSKVTLAYLDVKQSQAVADNSTNCRP